jgi:1-acyl-sn-glycerol-3-phosphate acyltransferase
MLPPLTPKRSYLPAVLEVIAAFIARLLYRVRFRGAEHIPAKGGAIIIANHLSYVDPVVLQLACPRPIRFIGHKSLRENAFFDWVFRMSGAIAISSQSPTDAMRRAIKAAESGEIVAIFPEGHISRTGQLMAIQRGFEVIARRAGVPIIPAFIDGVWGSLFSFAGNTYLWKSPRLKPTPVCVRVRRAHPGGPGRCRAHARKILLDRGRRGVSGAARCSAAPRPRVRAGAGQESRPARDRGPHRRAPASQGGTAARRGGGAVASPAAHGAGKARGHRAAAGRGCVHCESRGRSVRGRCRST